MATSATDGMYVDYSIPLGLYDLIQGVISTDQSGINTPQVTSPPAIQQWFSQPRSGKDTTTEVIQVNFKLPLSVSEVGWEILRTSCHTEVWYQDRQNNWRQMLDDNRIPIALDLSTSSTDSWYTAHYYAYPVVAKCVQLRITRTYDPQVGTLPYVVGIRNTLIRRNIYTRTDGTQGIEPQQDPIGNIITSYVKDWDASKAIDNDPTTFWRSMPLPDPQAVCSMYLDVRTPAGGPQVVDSLYIDPVYINQTLNLYYSNDDTVNGTKISPVSTVPPLDGSGDINTSWREGVGRWDNSPRFGGGSTLIGSTSYYEFPLAWGPLVSQDAWVGIEWTPDFSPVHSSAVQTVTITGGPTGGSFTLTLNSHTSGAISYNASAATLQNLLGAVTGIGVGNISVGGPNGGPWTVAFQGSLGEQAINPMTATPNFTGGTSPAVTATTTVTGGSGEAPPQDPVLFEVTPSAVEGISTVQTVTLTDGPTGGTFKLTYCTTYAVQVVSVLGTPTGGTFALSFGGNSTTPIPYNAASTVVQTALRALPVTGASTITVTGSSGGPYTVTFAADPMDLIQTDPTLLTGGTLPHITVIPSGQITGPLNYDCTFSDVQTALSGLSSIGTGNVLVSGDGGVTGLASGPFTVVFQGALAHRPVPTMIVGNNSLTGPSGSVPEVVIATTTPGAVPVAATPGQYVPKIYYDVGGEIALGLTDGTTPLTYAVPVVFSQGQTLRIAVGWTYANSAPAVMIAVNDTNGNVLGTQTWSVPSLPPQISFDGDISFSQFRGNFTAHVVKLENYTSPSAAFLANPQIYVSPDPVQPDASGNIPATTLDNAIYAGAWVTQEFGMGGSDQTNFEDKLWMPIWADYLVAKGKLYFPSQISMKYLKLEFTNLTEEPYPVYDSGIQVSYVTFPVSVTQSQTTTHPGLLQEAQGLLSAGADILLTGIGTVNWLNPSTVNNAVNSIFGQTSLTPITVSTGAGSISTLPNTTDLDLAGQTRQEVSTTWVYKRSPIDSTTLAATAIKQIVGGQPVQGLQTIANTIGDTVAAVTTAANTFVSNLASLPSQGSDWWVFPGGTLRMPAAIMNGLTAATQTIVGRAPTTTDRIRFSTTSVHKYATRTVTRDSAVAYFAGLREVQPFVLTYIDGQDPPNFTFSQYDLTQWVPGGAGIKQLDSGPITTMGNIYELVNGQFDGGITDWAIISGGWAWDGTVGHWDDGTATIIADGTQKELQSLEMAVGPGATFNTSVWVTWAGLAATSGSEAIQLQAKFYDNSGTFVSVQAAGLTNSPWPAATPNTGGNIWAQLTSSAITVPARAAEMRLSLVVTPAATAGQIWFDTVIIGTSDTVEASVYKDFTTTSSFTKLELNFTDSGLVRSDSMWTQSDPNDSNVSATALAYYTSTIPDVIPQGMWGDTIATWGDPVITWGEPQSVVSINVDPDRIYDNKRVLHFTRAAEAGSVAGVKVRQVTNLVPNGLFRIGCVFYKPNANNNVVGLDLIRVSDGVSMISGAGEYGTTFTPTVGYWYNYVTGFYELPASEDQEYSVHFVCSGDDADEMYLNDLYIEIAQVRYHVQMGPEGGVVPLYDVTPLAVANNTAVCSCTQPVNEFSVNTTILTPKAYAYSAEITPIYLQ